MGKIVVSEFITVDGVMEDPAGLEKTTRGGWASEFSRAPEGVKFTLDEVQSADALLLGRKTYQGFAAAWPSQIDEVGLAAKMNAMPKYVVSRTLRDPEWSNTTVLSGDFVGAVFQLKEAQRGELLVNGSCQLVHALIDHNLVDEVRLMVFPVVLGAGLRLFGDRPHAWPFRLLESRAVGPDGVLVVRYEPKPQNG